MHYDNPSHAAGNINSIDSQFDGHDIFTDSKISLQKPQHCVGHNV